MVRSIVWFRQDLRLHDNEALLEAIRNSDELILVYIFDPRQFASSTSYGVPKTGVARTTFLIESVDDIRKQLRSIGSDLVVRIGKPEEILYEIASDHKAHFIYCNRERTKEEVDVQDLLEKKLWAIGRELRYSRGKMLYYTADLPFPVTHCPDSFATFKKETEQLIPVREPLQKPGVLPPFPVEVEPGEIPSLNELMPGSSPAEKYFNGGETAGLVALNEGVNLSPAFMAAERTLLSPWIALGCLSPKTVYYASEEFPVGGEEVQQNLLYRDYLRLMGKKYGDQIFYKTGIKGGAIKINNDPAALARWQQGETGIGIIDAGMHQLNQAGWLPDPVRRLVAAFFIKVLNLDWRLGAAYFESRLIDYDPCTNWVSWLNMAGLGPDTREDRIINYEGAGKKLDPTGTYAGTWLPQATR